MFFLAAPSAPGAPAQGGDGRSSSVSKVFRVSAKRHYRKPDVRRPRAPIPAPVDGRLAVLINESGSELLLSSSSEATPRRIATTSRASTFILRSLPAGNYKLLVRKPGYFDEARAVDIVAGKRRSFRIVMRPRLAILSVNSNVADADIEISRVGRFRPPLRKFMVQPGLYTMSVKRRGYLSQDLSIDLRSPGREQTISVVLQPMRVDAVLDKGESAIAGGHYDSAAALVNDILKLNPEHARANLLFGLAEFHLRRDSSISYLIKAIKDGEKLSLPVHIETTTVRKSTVLEISRERLSFMSRPHAELNFAFSRSAIVTLESEAPPPNTIVLSGESDFHGREIRPHVRIVHHNPLLFPLLLEWRTLELN